MRKTIEHERLESYRTKHSKWKKWGPYLSERAWGTVRENEKEELDPWKAMTYEDAQSRAYRWNEDGIGGISDRNQRICLALALWNGKDPFLKERMFGLANPEGNHGEDLKEYYFYLDNTPTHSFMKMLTNIRTGSFPIKFYGKRTKNASTKIQSLSSSIPRSSRKIGILMSRSSTPRRARKIFWSGIRFRIEVWKRQNVS